MGFETSAMFGQEWLWSVVLIGCALAPLLFFRLWQSLTGQVSRIWLEE